MALLSIVYRSDYLNYDFGPQHPFTPDRWEALADLLQELKLPADWIEPQAAEEEDVLTVHRASFVEAIKAASAGFPGSVAQSFGLGTSDVPVFYGMHEATLNVCGGSLKAAALILDGSVRRVLQLGGGLHHAMPANAAGFCVYNDVAMLIYALRRGGMRVAYIDVDVHHGDGVQAIFYDDPDVLTISLHESGRFLYPGSGHVQELGEGEGHGMSINVPLFPGTDDAGYVRAFDAVVPECVRKFAPDAIVVELGADAHFQDPLAHLSITTRAFEKIFDRIVALSDDLTDGRLAVTLGGGYKFDSTLRVWTLLAHRLADHRLPQMLPESWIRRWEDRRQLELKSTIHDTESPVVDTEHQTLVRSENQKTIESLIHKLEEMNGSRKD